MQPVEMGEQYLFTERHMSLPTFSIVIAIFALCLLVAPLHAAEPNLVLNGNFAVDSDNDGMADNWAFSGDANVKVTWARDAGAHGGYSQKLTCTSIVGTGPATHAMLAQVNTISLKKGHWYRLSFNARGEIPSTAVSVAIRQMDTWEDCGLSDVFRVRPEWHPEQFVFRATQDIATNTRLQIWFTEVGTLWLDDVRLVELSGEPAEAERRFTEVVPPTDSKNLIPNSSFECGTSGWGTLSRGVDWGSSGLNSLFGTIDDSTAADGRSSFRIDLDRSTAPVLGWDYFDPVREPVLDPMVANRGWISVEPGRDYTLSAYVRSDPAGVPCALAVREASDETQRRAFAATGKWQRVTFTFKPRAKQLFVAVGPDLRESQLQKACVWVDAIQLERGATATEHSLRSPVEVGIEWERPGHLFSSPAEARAILTAFNATDQTKTVGVKAIVTDFFDRTAALPRVTLTLAPHSSEREVLNFGVRDKGFYRFRLAAFNVAGASPVQAADSVAVLPINAERFAVVDPASDSAGLFGMNHAYADPRLIRLSKDIGLNWFRDWSLKWQQVEPQKGRFDFDMTDFQIDRVYDQGLNVLGLLPFPSSDWGSSAPPDVKTSHDMGEHARQAYKPRDLSEYATYVRTTVGRYKDRVHVWEILNEPLTTGYSVPQSTGHTVADYVAILKTAYQAIKEVDPSARVIGGVASDPDVLASEFIAAGGLKWLDGINIHIYPVFRLPEIYIHGLETLNAMMKEAGMPRPIYFTEGAYYGDDDLPIEPYSAGDELMKPLGSETECASYLARFVTILLSQNVRTVIYHAGVAGALNEPSVGGIFFEWDGAPRKMAVSQAVITSLLGTDVTYLGSAWDHVRSFAFHSRAKTVVVVWDDTFQHLALTPHAGGPRILNLAGAAVTGKNISLGGTPYYLVFDRELSLDQLQSALRNWIGLEDPETSACCG
ncbi:MAG: carbohydrate binding domain-containing protein [Armatimonadota bacterium]